MKVKPYHLLVLLLVFSSLDAFSFLGIPLEWIYNAVFIALGGMMINRSPFLRLKYTYSWCFFICLLVYFSIYFVIGTNYDINQIYPSNTSTGYYIYVALRYLSLIVPLIAILLIGHLKRERYNFFKKVIVFWGFLTSCYAIYSYFAPYLDLPTLTKSRMSTSGGTQQNIYTNYIINRATGTFREPAFLANWLLVPFLLSFERRTKRYVIARIGIVLAILMTGSLSGFLALFFGIGVYFAVISYKNVSWHISYNSIRKIVGGSISAVLLGGIILYIFQNSINVDITQLFTFLYNRIEPIIEGFNITDTNRGQAYIFLMEKGVPWIGWGPGNGNLILTQFKGTATISSFLSIYLNYLYATGLLFSPLLLLIFGYPVYLTIKNCRKISPSVIAIFATMLLVSGVLYQEFSTVLILSICLVLYEAKKDPVQSHLSD